MSPASFGLKPCGRCLLFFFYSSFHIYIYFFTFSNSALSHTSLFTCCCRLSCSLTLILLAIFLFLWVSLLKHHAHTRHHLHPTAQKPLVGRRTDESGFAPDCTVFPRRVLLCFLFYPVSPVTMVSALPWRWFRLLYFAFFFFKGVSMTGE